MQSPQQDDQFQRHLVRWWVWAFQTLSANEISQIWKSKMASPAILKNWKILISSQPIDRFCQNLTCSWVLVFWTLFAKKFGDFKNKRWRQRPFGISKNRNISALDRPVLKKFGIVMFLIPPNRVSIKKFMLLIIQHVGELPSGKYKKCDL